MFAKISALTLVSALALTACTPAERVAETSPVLLGDVNNVKMYADDVDTLTTEWNVPELSDKFDALMTKTTEGVQGTPAQLVLSTPGLEEFFQEYAEFTEYSADFERNLFACHVDNLAENVEMCIQDLYSSTYDN